MTFPFPFVNVVGTSKLTFEPVSISAVTTPTTAAIFTADLPVGLIVFLETCRSISGFGGARPLVSVDVGGDAGVVVIDGSANENVNASISMYENLVAGNKTVNLTHNGGLNNAWVDAYVLTGYQSTAAHDTKLDSSTGGTSKSVNIDIPAGGIALAVLSKNNNAAATWTGATARDTRDRIKTALYQAEAASPGHAIDVSWASSTGSRLVAASWS